MVSIVYLPPHYPPTPPHHHHHHLLFLLVINSLLLIWVSVCVSNDLTHQEENKQTLRVQYQQIYTWANVSKAKGHGYKQTLLLQYMQMYTCDAKNSRRRWVCFNMCVKEHKSIPILPVSHDITRGHADCRVRRPDTTNLQIHLLR